MFTQNPRNKSLVITSEKANSQARLLDCTVLQEVVDNFIDGILILTEQGELLHANNLAHQIFTQLTLAQPQSNKVPQEIWHICQALSQTCDSYANPSQIIESEITIGKSTKLRIRARWLKLNVITHPYLLVLLEDRHQSIRNLVLAEVDQYRLTPREAEVWLLRRTNYTCKEIASLLYISLNTVKKHMKNIQAKRETVLDMDRC
jgi:DNA-binding CsgD family transcriptional regulator